MVVDESVISKTNVYTKEYDASYPNHLGTISTNWTQEKRTVLKEAYNYKFRNLCEILDYGYTNVKPTEGLLTISKDTTYEPSIWPWTVPYGQEDSADIIAEREVYIQPSSLVSPSSEGCEIVNKITKNNGSIRISRSVLANSSSGGIGVLDAGKSTGYEGKPFNYGGVKRFIENEIPTDYELNLSFPWNAIGPEGVVGPTGMVEMIDDSGNYWIAIGDEDNKIPSQFSSDDFINTYTIMMVPENKVDEFENLVVSLDNYEDSLLQVQTFDKKDWSEETVSARRGTYVSTRGSRNREGFLELANSRVGENFFSLFIKVFDYNLERAESHPYSEIEFNSPAASGGSNYELLFEPELRSEILPINRTDLVSSTDAQCSCDFCNEEDVEDFTPSIWKQHNHDEWVVSNLESPFAGPFSRDGFNVWLSAGQDPRWGSVLWSTVDEGKAWMTFRQARLGIDEVHGNITTIIVSASFRMTDFSGNYQEIPLYFTYDEFIFELEDYTPLKEVQRLLEIDDNDVVCDDTLLTYVNPKILLDCQEEATAEIDISSNL
jgi:hypothetical protein